MEFFRLKYNIKILRTPHNGSISQVSWKAYGIFVAYHQWAMFSAAVYILCLKAKPHVF
jgi:hypothetical protein